MNIDKAMNLVIDFVREHGFEGKIVPCDIERRGSKIDIALLKPYGLFIVHEDERVEDNYRALTEQQCEDCGHKAVDAGGGHCYMFHGQPVGRCAHHTSAAKSRKLSPAGRALVSLAILGSIFQESSREE